MTVIWHKEPSSFTAWGFDRSGSSTRRLTENGYVRVTEQSVVRIIERMRTQWSNQVPTVNLWTKE